MINYRIDCMSVPMPCLTIFTLLGGNERGSSALGKSS